MNMCTYTQTHATHMHTHNTHTHYIHTHTHTLATSTHTVTHQNFHFIFVTSVLATSMTLQEPILSDWREEGRRVGEGEGEGREEWRERGRKERGGDQENITFASNFLIV